MSMRLRTLVAVALVSGSCAATPQYDVVIRHGTVYDGTGAAGVVEDVALQGDRVAAVGALGGARGRTDVDASGLAVAPGFIDMLNHSETSLLADGRSLSGIRQGVTLAVFGESSMGPLSDAMKRDMTARQGDIKYDISWTTLGEYLDTLVSRGVSTNVAAESGGMYISHMRSEGNRLLEAIDETVTIAREAHIRAEIYHQKAAGR